MKTLANSALAAALWLIAGAASADPTPAQLAAAETLFREARDLVAQNRYAEACPKFAASQQLDPGYGTLWNFADCEEHVGHTATAWRAFRDASAMAKAAGQEERDAKATRRADDLEPKLERVRITVAAPVPGIVVRADDVVLDASKLGEPFPVDPGKHVITASAPGKKDARVEVATTGPGEPAAVQIPALEDAPPPAPVHAPPPAPPPEAPAGGRRMAGYALTGVGVVGLAVGSVAGLAAKSKWDDAQTNHCRTEDLCDASGVKLAGGALTAATVSTVGFVIGAAGVASGIVLIAMAPSSAPSPPTGLRLSPMIGPGIGGIQAGGAL